MKITKALSIVKTLKQVNNIKDSMKDVDTSKLSLEEAKKLYEEGKISKGELDDVAIRLHEQNTHDELDNEDIDDLIAEEYEAIADYEAALKITSCPHAQEQLTHILEEEKEHVRELEELKAKREQGIDDVNDDGKRVYQSKYRYVVVDAKSFKSYKTYSFIYYETDDLEDAKRRVDTLVVHDNREYVIYDRIDKKFVL